MCVFVWTTFIMVWSACLWYREDAWCIPSGTDLGATAYAFDVQASSTPPVPGKVRLGVNQKWTRVKSSVPLFLQDRDLTQIESFFPGYLLHVWSTSVWQAARQWWKKQVADCVCIELFTATSTSRLSAYRQKVLLHVLIVNLPFYFLCTSSSLIRV